MDPPRAVRAAVPRLGRKRLAEAPLPLLAFENLAGSQLPTISTHSGESQARHSFPTSSSEAIPSLPNPSKVEHVFPTHPSGVDQSFLTPRSGVAQSVPNHSRVLTPLSTPSSESIPSRSTSSSGVLNPLPILHRPVPINPKRLVRAAVPRLERKRLAEAPLPLLAFGDLRRSDGPSSSNQSESPEVRRPRYDPLLIGHSAVALPHHSRGLADSSVEPRTDSFTREKVPVRLKWFNWDVVQSPNQNLLSKSTPRTAERATLLRDLELCTSSPSSSEVKEARSAEEGKGTLTHGQKVGKYVIVGSGYDCHAVTPDGEVLCAKVISREDYEVLLAVDARLKMAEDLCAHEIWDTDDLREAVLPSSWEAVEEKERNLIVYLSPVYHESLLIRLHGAPNRRLKESEVAEVFKQMTALMAFCHTISIMVRDPSPRKLVFPSESYKRLRLADVFHCIVCDVGPDDTLREKRGLPAYVSPEVLFENEGFGGRAADVWALGVLIYMLLCGRYPFFDVKPSELFRKIRQATLTFPQDGGPSEEACIFICNMMRRMPEERPSARFLMTLPFGQEKQPEDSDIEMAEEIEMKS